MPNLDGTGPQGQGPMTGRGLGKGLRNQSVSSKPKQIAGGVAECTCPKCGASAPHLRGKPCSLSKCPKCATPMRGVFCN